MRIDELVVGGCAGLTKSAQNRRVYTPLTATDEDGQHRLDDPDDIVRLEITAALKRNIRVIPILVEGAVMPAASNCRRP